MEKIMSEFWYKEYYCQSWYPQTYVVNKTTEISRYKENRNEKDVAENTIKNCGCHLTCYAMMVNIDPARLAGACSLSKRLKGSGRFRRSKKDEFQIKSWFVTEGLQTSLKTQKPEAVTWQMPWSFSVPIQVIDNSGKHRRMGNCEYSFMVTHDHASKQKSFLDLKDLNTFIRKHKSKNTAIIVGPKDHSLLVAGTNCQGEHFVWDPDIEDFQGDFMTVEQMLNGQYTLQKMIKNYQEHYSDEEKPDNDSRAVMDGRIGALAVEFNIGKRKE